MRNTAGMRRSVTPQRVLATVLFTDIVGSTEMAASLGDRRWRQLVARHHAVVRAQLKRHHGREIDTAGDGFFAIFDSPAQAIDCAAAIVNALKQLGLEIRAGLHTGEVEQTGKAVGGIAVHIGARVMATAGPGEIVVTGTVKDLVTGSDIGFVDRGATTLKGVEGEWRLFTVVPRPERAPAVPEGFAEERTGRYSRGWAVRALIAALLAGLAGVAAAAVLLSWRPSGPVVPGADTVGRIRAGAHAFDMAVEVGQRPTGLASGDGSIWVTNFADQTLSRIDPASGKAVANPAVGGTPSGVTFGAGGIWVTTHFGLTEGDVGSVVRFDTRPVKVRAIPVGSGVDAIAFGEGFVWVADRIDEVVRKVDPNTNDVAPGEVPVGRAPGSIAVGVESIWVGSTLDQTVWRIDPETYEVQAKIALPGPPSSIAVSETAVWVTSEAADAVFRIDPRTNARVTTVPDLDGPRGVAISDGAVWVALGREGKLARIDPATNTVVERFEVRGVPDAVVVDEEDAVWVTVWAP
jgi:YVTN family beta-propeller protein